MKRLRNHQSGEYAGMSYQQASQKALEVVKVAAETGQTIEAAMHLNELAGIMLMRVATGRAA